MKLVIECDPWGEGNAARRAQSALNSLGVEVEIRELRLTRKDDAPQSIMEALSPFAIKKVEPSGSTGSTVINVTTSGDGDAIADKVSKIISKRAATNRNR